MEALLDTGEFALTFAPGNFAGAAAGRAVRIIGEDIARDPTGWLATRQALRDTLPSDAGVIDFGAFARRERLPLVDGTVLHPATGAQEAAAVERALALPEGPILSRGGDAAYQARVYGDVERIVAIPDGTYRSLDGVVTQYGGIPGDSKFVRDLNARSWNVPETLRSDLGQVAIGKMDRTITRLLEAADNMGGPRAIEIVTNSPAAATAWEARMRVLNIPGYVRLEP